MSLRMIIDTRVGYEIVRSKDQNHPMQEIVQKVIRYQQSVVEVNTNMISPKNKHILQWDRGIYYTFDNNSVYQRKGGHMWHLVLKEKWTIMEIKNVMNTQN